MSGRRRERFLITLFLVLPRAPDYLISSSNLMCKSSSHKSAALGTRELRSLKAAFPPVLRKHADATTRM
jgi:hypothetical protein